MLEKGRLREGKGEKTDRGLKKEGGKRKKWRKKDTGMGKREEKRRNKESEKRSK